MSCLVIDSSGPPMFAYAAQKRLLTGMEMKPPMPTADQVVDKRLHARTEFVRQLHSVCVCTRTVRCMGDQVDLQLLRWLFSAVRASTPK